MSEWKKNEVIELTITDLGSEGEGIGKLDGFPFFVKGALPGDRIRASVMKLRKGMGYARLQEIIEASPERREPECLVYGRCGGCQLMHLSYAGQLAYKEDKLKNALRRIGGVDAEQLERVMEPIIGMPGTEGVPLRYRNKAQYPFGTGRDKEIVYGFYAAHSHRIIPGGDCLLGEETDAQVLGSIRAWMEENGLTAYDEESGKGVVRHTLIRGSRSSGERMVCVVVNVRHLACEVQLAERLSGVPGVRSVYLNINQRRDNVILGEECRLLWGERKIRDQIRLLEYGSWEPAEEGVVEYRISPLSFYQVNPVQTERLYATALEYAALTGSEVVWDLYCGIGTISLFLAQRAGQVYGIDITPQAIDDARENAELNGIGNAEFLAGAAEELLPMLYEERRLPRPDVVVVDPPRKGCDRECLGTMVRLQPERIVYVSCDPATLARDVKYLGERGYALRRARACDMFPNSYHVETVVCLSRGDVNLSERD